MAHISAKKVVPANTDEGLTDEERATAAAVTGASAEEISNAVTRAINGDNAALWNILKRTDPKATKPFQRSGGFRGTQIDPAWRLQMMTEVFGPVGYGWGFEQVEWTIAERMIFICARVWISDPADRERKFYTGPQWGGTEIVRVSRDGKERPDDESFKMSMTDAIGKCFLQLGLAADIYLGQFDDSKYREESETIYTAKAKGWDDVGIKRFEKEVGEKLKAVADQDGLADLWKEHVSAKAGEIKPVNKDAHDRIIAAFATKKKDILKAEEQAKADKQLSEEEAEQGGADQSDATPAAVEQEAPQQPVQADQPAAAAKPRDQIDNALDALRKGDDEQPDSGKTPAPIAIKVMKNEDSSPNWSGFFNAAKAQIIKATDDEYGDAWLVEWLKVNDEGMVGLRQANPKAADKINGMYMQSLDYQKTQREEAEAEALTEFPTIEVTYQGDSPDWPAFLRNLHNYLGDTPNHRVARAWWTRHSFQVGIIAKTDEVEPGVSGKAAAAEFKAALFARFPQLAD